MKLVVALIAGFICIFPAVGFASPSASAPPEGMVHIPGGTYPMGSHKSLLELDPVDLFNTDRHALGPENPAHNVELEPYYIDMYEVTHGSYMKFIEATNAKKPRFWDDPDFNSPKTNTKSKVEQTQQQTKKKKRKNEQQQKHRAKPKAQAKGKQNQKQTQKLKQSKSDSKSNTKI